jgi:hypothetical protein
VGVETDVPGAATDGEPEEVWPSIGAMAEAKLTKPITIRITGNVYRNS